MKTKKIAPNVDQEIFGCKKLLTAFLMRAICDLTAKGLRATNLGSRGELIVIHRSALNWFRDASFEPYSYLWTCEVLGLDHTRITEKLSQLGLLQVRTGYAPDHEINDLLVSSIFD